MARYGKNHKGGRPKGSKSNHTLEKEAARAKAIAMVDEELEEIFRPQIDKAKEGDTAAINAVLNRAWGTPAQYLELTGKDGKDLFVPTEKIKKLADELVHGQRNI